MYITSLINGERTIEVHNEKERLKKGNVVKGINSIDSFSFSILPSNVGFAQIYDLQTLVTVYDTRRERYSFQGRVLYSRDVMEESGLISKEVVCESYLGFLCDSKQLYVGEKNWTVKEFLQHIVEVHNSQMEEYKHFVVGKVDLADENIYVGIQRDDSWVTITEKLIKKIGGEIRVRVEGNVKYLDFLEKIGRYCSTGIVLTKNMKSISREHNPLEFISRLIPLGAKLKDEFGNETEERLDITSVNNGLNYIENQEARAVYGIRYGYVEFDDVTVASNLYNKGMDYLIENSRVQTKYSITALDLSILGLEIEDFEVHNYYPIKNPLLGIDDMARGIKQNIDIVEEIKSAIEIGDNFKTLSDIQRERDRQVSELLKRKEQNQYLHIRYSAYADGTNMTKESNENTRYIGTCVTNSKEAPSNPAAYTWTLIKGEPGDAGKNGWEILVEFAVSNSSTVPPSDYAVQLTSDVILISEEEQLDTPTIYLSEENGSTSAVLGEAVLGQMILGTGSSGLLEQLDTPTIYLHEVVEAEEKKLDAPVITLQSSVWSKLPPIRNEGEFVWQRITYIVWDGSVIVGEPVCITGDKGDKGNGIKEVKEYYTASSSNSEKPTEWQDSIPELNATQKYLWNYEEIIYSDGGTTVTPAGVIGVLGDDGNGIEGVYEYYALSIASNVIPNSWSDEIPTMTNYYKYLWNYEEIVFTDGTKKTTKPCIIGVYGDTGNAGRDAVSFRVESTLGIAFLEGVESTTTLTARMYKGAVEVDSEGVYGYTWYLVDKEGNERLLGNGKTLEVSTSTLAGMGVYFIADDGGASEEMVQLDTPTIELVEINNKLDAPVIYLEESAKLDTPVIELYEEE